MSGHKCSKYRLRQERQEKLKALQELRNLQSEVVALQEAIAQELTRASEGLRATFAGEAGRARRWSGGRQPAPEFTMADGIGAIRAAVGEGEQAAAEGRLIHAALTLAFTRKADALGRQLATRLAEVERLLLSRRELLGMWFGREKVAGWQSALEKCRRMLEDERYGGLQPALENLQAELEDRGQLAARQEEEHQQRLYLLKALRQVCHDLGFRELSPPRHEREGDRASRLILEVERADRGLLTFFLALDGLSSLSEMERDDCPGEFGQLSQHLEEEFGIQTSFHTEDGRPLPRLIEREELELPGSAATGMEQDG